MKYFVLTAIAILLSMPGCGDDDNPCPEGHHLCGNMCANFDVDDDHCGKCDNDCGIYADCIQGTCQCIAGWAECDEDPSVKCETDTNTETDHCGACDNAFGAGESCVKGVCT